MKIGYTTKKPVPNRKKIKDRINYALFQNGGKFPHISKKGI